MSNRLARRQPRWLPDLSEIFTGFPSWVGPRPSHLIRLEDEIEDGHYVVRAEMPGIDPANDGYVSQSYTESGQTDYTITLSWTTPLGCRITQDNYVNAKGAAYSSDGTSQVDAGSASVWFNCIG